MNLRKSAILLAITCCALLAVPVAAGAAQITPATSLTGAPVTGLTHNGKAFTGKFTVTQFVTRAGKTYAVGTLTGKIGSRSISSRTIEMPAAVTPGASSPASARARGRAAAVMCPILHLVLGPLNLHLLGLNVRLNQVVLDITATPGPGNLLGNLLCSVANLLNPGTLPVGQVTGLLNIIQQLLNNPALLNL